MPFKKRTLLLSLVFIGFLLSQACARRLEPQEACNFVQNNNQQRVSWQSNTPVKIYVHSSVPSSAYASIERAADTWNNRLGRQVIRIEGWGVTGLDSPMRDNYSIIYWRSTWDPKRYTEQARTTIYWSGDQIYEADMRINDYHFDFYTGMESSFSGVDLTSLVVHEMGHVLGLGHNSAQGSVMNVSLSSGVERREPSKVDMDSIHCEY